MQPQLITVHDIKQAIEDVGVMPYANTLVQEMAGGFFFVEARLIGTGYMSGEILFPPDGWTMRKETVKRTVDGLFPDGKTEKETVTVYWHFKINPIPVPLAHFIIETLRLKAQFSRLGVGDIDQGVEQAVYLTPGKTIFGHKIEELTEIPAELGPVVVERL